MLKRIFRGDSGNVFKGMLTLLAGASLGRIIGLLSMPVLARIYSPDDFGILALYTSFVSILAPMITLRYVQAVPLPKTDVMAFCLLIICVKFISLFFLIICFFLILWGHEILVFFGMEELTPWRWLIAVGVAGSALYELFTIWAARRKKYKAIAKTQFSQSLIGNLTKVGLGFLGFKPAGLIVGQLLTQSAGIISLVRVFCDDFKCLLLRVTVARQKLVLIYYQGFPWFRLPSQILMVLSIQAPVLMMAALYSKELTGQLSLALMALSIPVGLIGNSMSKAYYAEVASLGKNNIEVVISITCQVQKNLFLAGFPIFLIVYFIAEDIFRLVFGSEWGVAGNFASLLAPYILFQLTSSPLMEVFNIISSQAIYLTLQALRVFGLAGIFAYCKHAGIGVESFVIVLSFYLSLFYILASALVFILLLNKKHRARQVHEKAS